MTWEGCTSRMCGQLMRNNQPWLCPDCRARQANERGDENAINPMPTPFGVLTRVEKTAFLSTMRLMHAVEDEVGVMGIHDDLDRKWALIGRLTLACVNNENHIYDKEPDSQHPLFTPTSKPAFPPERSKR